jgi:hypothetical protein
MGRRYSSAPKNHSGIKNTFDFDSRDIYPTPLACSCRLKRDEQPTPARICSYAGFGIRELGLYLTQ